MPREELGSFLGVIGQDEVGAGSFDAGQDLHHDALSVDPAQLGGSLDHGVLAADVIGGQREVDS